MNTARWTLRLMSVVVLVTGHATSPALFGSISIGEDPQSDYYTGRAVVPVKEQLFPLTEIRLNGGPLGDQQELNRQYLMKIEPDRLLSWFRQQNGLEPKAPPYRGWESEGRPLAGHICGFYLSGASMMVEATGDSELKSRINYIIDELAAVQDANKSGYMLAVPNGKKIFSDIAAGHIDIGGLPWTGYAINGNFEPTYTLNKLMLGLREAYFATGNEKARQVLTRVADWFGHDVLDALSDSQVQHLLDCEHGSLHESFADVYSLTGDQKYLAWARRLCHQRMLQPLADNHVDFLTMYHANTQIPKFTGFERIYGLAGDNRLDQAAVNFWNEVVDHRSWVIGGNSADEHFYPPADEEKAVHRLAGPESCNSVNMLRLTESLFRYHPSVELVDYYERTLFNHMLSSHDPERAMCCYYTSMRPGAYRVYSDEFDSMWCCTGTGLEVPGKYGQMIFTHASDDSSLEVNLFAPSTLTWATRKIVLHQTTDFPDQPTTTLQITDAPQEGAHFKLRVRYPKWVAAGGLQVHVNTASVAVDAKPGEYAEIDRTWLAGDRVQIDLPMHLTTENLHGDNHYVALLYGPIVLSGHLGLGAGLTKADFWQITTSIPTKLIPEAKVPTIVTDDVRTITSAVTPVQGQPLTFRTSGLAQPADVELIPFFRNHFERYAIYWPTATQSQWNASQQQAATAQAKLAELDARSIDSVRIGDNASETEHHLEGNQTETGIGAYSEAPDSHWRDARNGGWFSYQLKTDPSQANTLRLTFWGQERGERTFDVLVNNRILKTSSLGDTGRSEFIDQDMPIPADLLKATAGVSVKLQAHPGNTAGGLFDLRVLRE